MDPFEAWAEAIVDRTGYRVRWVEAWHHHVRLGSIHCGTDVLRQVRRNRTPRPAVTSSAVLTSTLERRQTCAVIGGELPGISIFVIALPDAPTSSYGARKVGGEVPGDVAARHGRRSFAV